MLRGEAEELKKLIDSFVVDVDAPPMEEVAEGEIIPPEIDPIPQPKELTEAELKKAFRHQVPEDFDPSKVEMIRSPQTGDRVFLKYGDERRWVPDLETLEAFGFTLADVKDITDEEVSKLKESYGLLSTKLW